MARPRYDHRNWKDLARRPKYTTDGTAEALPRRTQYGTIEAERIGLTPLSEYPELLIQPEDFREVIGECRQAQVFPIYHQDNSGLLEIWNQDGYPFCWAYGGTATVMGNRAREGQKPVALSPFSLCWLTGWRKRGFYLDDTIAGIRERGIAPLSYVPEYNLNPRTFREGWEEAALNYRLSEWWDIDTRRGDLMTIRQCLTVLATGVPLYVAYNWWGHAAEVVGMSWDPKYLNNIIWEIQNSHGDGVIELAGSRGVPDEAYAIRSGSLPA